MKNLLKIRRIAILIAFFLTTNQFLYGQYEFDYMDGETIGTKGIYDNQSNLFVSTGGVKKVCNAKDVYFAYVMRSYGSLSGPAIYVGDNENDYFGTDIKKLDDDKYFVVGYTTRAQTFPGVWDVNNSTLTKYYNAFIALVDCNNPAGGWLRVLGNPNTNDKALAITVDENRTAWITGIANEQAPCKMNTSQNCSQNCYASGNVLFARFDEYGAGMMVNQFAVSGETWSQGNDIYSAYGKLFIAATVSNSSCCSGNNSSASVISYDPSSLTFSNLLLSNYSGNNFNGMGLYPDFNGGMYMVGDITSQGDGYLWNFSPLMNTIRFNVFHANSQNYTDWNFKSLVSDSICNGYDSLNHRMIYSKELVITGDINTSIAPFSNMFAFKVNPANLTNPWTVSGEFKAYVNNSYSKNANIAAVYDSCGRDSIYAIFGFSHDPVFMSKTAYIAGVNNDLRTGCEIADSFYFYIDSIPESYPNIENDTLYLLDSFYQQVMGMNEMNLCDNQLNPPGMSNAGGSDNNNSAQGMVNTTDISIHPNPANNTVIVKQEMAFNKAYVNIYDNAGKLVRRIDIPNDSKTIEINTSSLSNGIYYFSIMNNGLLTTKKVVKQE